MIQKQPNAFIFAGANASGKSTYISHLLQNKIVFGEYINPDLILKEELKLKETLENYTIAFEIAQKRRDDAIKNSKDIIVETVFSTQNKIDYVYKLISHGYHVTLFFTGTDEAGINLLYLLDRVEKGGHDVPVRKLIDRRLRGFENIRKISQDIDCLIFVDNSIYGEPPIIVKSMYRNNICFINDAHHRDLLWLNDIIDLERTHVFNKDELKIVPKEHLQLCENIQNTSDSFVKILDKTYQEKNQILKIEIIK
ncbi:MAG: zeta toxin family protein [Campylobacterota bacterium]|nr:zeta toxin family protein [Campylobacterota bacterium]